MLFTQLLVNGLIAGGIYALVAIGFSLIYSTNRVMHLAHGISVVASSYFLYTLFVLLHLNIFVSGILTVIFAGLFGLAINKFIYTPLQDRKASSVILLIASVAVLILVENILILLFGASVKSLGLESPATFNILGATITATQIALICTSLVLFVATHLFMKKTKLGRNMRAVSDSKELSSIIGINHKKIADISFILGSGIAGLAGILIAIEQHMYPGSATPLILKGFTGAIMGGISSVPGAVLGSYILGIAENLGIWFLPSGYKDAIAFILLLAFLLWKPKGLFGINKGVRE